MTARIRQRFVVCACWAQHPPYSHIFSHTRYSLNLLQPVPLHSMGSFYSMLVARDLVCPLSSALGLLDEAGPCYCYCYCCGYRPNPVLMDMRTQRGARAHSRLSRDAGPVVVSGGSLSQGRSARASYHCRVWLRAYNINVV